MHNLVTKLWRLEAGAQETETGLGQGLGLTELGQSFLSAQDTVDCSVNYRNLICPWQHQLQ